MPSQALSVSKRLVQRLNFKNGNKEREDTEPGHVTFSVAIPRIPQPAEGHSGSVSPKSLALGEETNEQANLKDVAVLLLGLKSNHFENSPRNSENNSVTKMLWGFPWRKSLGSNKFSKICPGK